MKGFLAAAALAGVALASPMPQASGSACSPDRAGQFTITVVNVTRSAKRDVEARQLDGTLKLSLAGGILKDQAGRTGYIAANRQFQFDNPIQAGAVVTSGWSVCGNNSLALGGSAIFYQCLSGTFYNLYDQSQGNQCNPIYIVAQSGSAVPSAAASVLSDGQPQATTAVTQLSDGQPQATTLAAPPVTVLSDGQPQATSVQGPPVTVLSDGQPQATSVQGPPVTVLSDGQPQATTAQGPAVTVLSDGQPQAPTVSQISDGQIQAPTSTGAIATFTGAANRNAGGFAFVAGIVGAVALL